MNSPGSFVMAGDIGGTKTLLGLYSDCGDRLEALVEASFANKEYSSIDAVIDGFLSRLDKIDSGRIRSATLGVAGPVHGDRGTLTNLSWTIDAGELGARFSIRDISVINDLVATAWYVDAVADEDLFVLKPGTPQKGNAVVIAAGTGLGEAILFWDGRGYIPSASEGGHTDFAPTTPMQSDLLDYLAEIYGHVSYERVLSGRGLASIYSFLKSRRDSVEPAYLAKRFETEDAAAVISSEAINGHDKNCTDALDIFISVYGAEAGNLALKGFAVGGVYIAGGIAPKILPAMERGGFTEGFIKKGRFERLMNSIPVYVIMNRKAALRGAAIHASRSFADGTRRKAIRSIVERTEP